jgi:hypothetical protein
MLKDKNSLCEILGKLVLVSAVGGSCFVIAQAFLRNDKKKAIQVQERLRQFYEGLSPEEY